MSPKTRTPWRGSSAVLKPTPLLVTEAPTTLKYSGFSVSIAHSGLCPPNPGQLSAASCAPRFEICFSISNTHSVLNAHTCREMTSSKGAVPLQQPIGFWMCTLGRNSKRGGSQAERDGVWPVAGLLAEKPTFGACLETAAASPAPLHGLSHEVFLPTLPRAKGASEAFPSSLPPAQAPPVSPGGCTPHEASGTSTSSVWTALQPRKDHGEASGAVPRSEGP